MWQQDPVIVLLGGEDALQSQVGPHPVCLQEGTVISSTGKGRGYPRANTTFIVILKSLINSRASRHPCTKRA